MISRVLVTYACVFVLEMNKLAQCVQLTFGDCPIYYEEPCRPEMVKFVLFTRKRNTTKVYRVNPLELILPEDYDPRAPLKILIHGYGGLGLDRFMHKIRVEYQSLGYNVLMVDWGPLAEVPCYAAAYLNTWHVGQCLAVLAVSLIPLGLHPASLHFVGFSLGAHIAGFAGANMKKVLKLVPGRITGLDPALPFFATLSDDWKLDASDARFVDVVHTSAGIFGKIEATGHVDFYVNGGVLQPSCHTAPYPPLCSHAMSGLYFANSIKDTRKFVGLKCDNVVNYVLGFCEGGYRTLMGEFVDKKARGSFYVETENYTHFVTEYYAYENDFVT